MLNKQELVTYHREKFNKIINENLIPNNFKGCKRLLKKFPEILENMGVFFMTVGEVDTRKKSKIKSSNADQIMCWIFDEKKWSKKFDIIPLF